MSSAKPNKGIHSIPRGMEVLVKKAAVDAAFRKILLERRAQAADEIGLSLDNTEMAMLKAIPQTQLEAIIANTRVKPRLRKAFMGYAAAMMLVALGCDTQAASESDMTMKTTGINPDIIEERTEKYWVDAESGARLPAGTLDVLVEDQAGNPIHNLELSISGGIEDKMSGDTILVGITGKTDKNGRYRLDPAPAGELVVETQFGSFRDFVFEKRSIEVVAGVTATLAFSMVEMAAYGGGVRPDLD